MKSSVDSVSKSIVCIFCHWFLCHVKEMKDNFVLQHCFVVYLCTASNGFRRFESVGVVSMRGVTMCFFG